MASPQGQASQGTRCRGLGRDEYKVLWARYCGVGEHPLLFPPFGWPRVSLRPPKSQGLSGKRSQLNRLQANLHPVTLDPLPPAVRIDGNGLMGSGVYLRLVQSEIRPNGNFKPHVPTIFPPATPTSQGTTLWQSSVNCGGAESLPNRCRARRWQR